MKTYGAKPKNKTKTKNNRNMFKRKKNKVQNPSAYDKALISWETPEYVVHERGIFWKIFMILLAIFVVVSGFYYGNWTLSLAVLVFAVVYTLIGLEHPQNVKVKLSDVGIKLGVRCYPYSRITNFWIIYEPPFVTTLNIHVDGEFIADITIQLNGKDPSEIRNFLIMKIPEMEGKRESLSDIFVRLFKI